MCLLKCHWNKIKAHVFAKQGLALFFWKYSKALGSHCIYSVTCIFSIMFYKGSLKLLSHLIRELKSISQQPLYELNTRSAYWAADAVSTFQWFKEGDKKQKQEESCHSFCLVLSVGTKMSGMEGEKKGRTERKNYSTATSQIRGRFKNGIGRLELGEDAFESVLIIDS